MSSTSERWALEFVDGPLDGMRLPTPVAQQSYHLVALTHCPDMDPVEPPLVRRHCYVRGLLCREEEPRPGVIERVEVEVWIYQGVHG